MYWQFLLPEHLQILHVEKDPVIVLAGSFHALVTGKGFWRDGKLWCWSLRAAGQQL